MCTSGCMAFAAKWLTEAIVKDSEVLEVGSRDVNGTVRRLAERHRPGRYVGVDVLVGPGVDELCSAENLVDRFGAQSFDVVISTEMLEHVPDWKTAVYQMKAVLRTGGWLILTTRSPGFQLHGYPADYWRFTTNDMLAIFADFDELTVEPDGNQSPGVFVAGMRCTRSAVPLESMSIYSVVTRGRRNSASPLDVAASKLLVGTKRRTPVLFKRMGRRVLDATLSPR